MATPYSNTAPDRMRDLFIVALRNAHALENQALSIMTPQVTRIDHYPELADRLRTHIDETHDQIARLDEMLAGFDTGGSWLKDTALGLTGGMAALGHSLATDEILKNSFANYAFEHFEIASYKSLLILAEDGGFGSATALLEQSLREEESMAEWIDQSLPVITRRYTKLYRDESAMVAKI